MLLVETSCTEVMMLRIIVGKPVDGSVVCESGVVDVYR